MTGTRMRSIARTHWFARRYNKFASCSLIRTPWYQQLTQTAVDNLAPIVEHPATPAVVVAEVQTLRPRG